MGNASPHAVAVNFANALESQCARQFTAAHLQGVFVQRGAADRKQPTRDSGATAAYDSKLQCHTLLGWTARINK